MADAGGGQEIYEKIERILSGRHAVGGAATAVPVGGRERGVDDGSGVSEQRRARRESSP